MAPNGSLLLLLLSLSAALVFLLALGPSRLSSGASTPQERGTLEREILAVPRAAAWGPGRLSGRAASGSAVHPSDAAALLSASADFKRANSMDERGFLDTWEVRRPCAEWYGVTCDADTGRVTRLNLAAALRVEKNPQGWAQPLGFQLYGPPPAALGLLPDLQTLILRGNGLDRERGFPSTWAHGFPKLSHLDLSDCASDDGDNENQPALPSTLATVPGPVPAWLGHLQQLTSLDISNCGLTGNLPSSLGRLSRLVTLLLRANQLKGQLPRELGQLKMLQELDLAGNSLDGPIPAELGGLKALADLRLGSNSLSGSIPAELGSLDSLTFLSLFSNSLTGSLPNAVVRDGLQLNVQYNSLSGPLPPNMGKLIEAFLANRPLYKGPVPFPVHAFGNLLCGPCFGSAVVKCNASDYNCAASFAPVIQALSGNCLRDCPGVAQAPVLAEYPNADPLGRDRSTCPKSCGSDD